MANSKTSSTVSATTGTFTGTVNGETFVANQLLVGIDTGTLTIYIDEHNGPGAPFNFLSLHIDESLDGKFEIKFSSRKVRFFYENQSGLYRPREDNTLYFEFSHINQTYKGHFKDFVFGPFMDDEIGKTYNISGKFDLTGRVDPSKYKDKLNRYKKISSPAV